MLVPPSPGLRILGLLGGVGAGKSTAARALGRALEAAAPPECPLETRVLDADARVRALLAEPEVVAALVARLGPGLRRPGGALDRRALGERVFADPRAREEVEALLHPRVRQAFHRELAELEATGRPAWALLDVPLLLERGLDALCDLLLFVAAPTPVRAARARARHGWSEAEWRAREAAQSPLAEKEGRAHAILDNSGSRTRLARSIEPLLPRLLAVPPRPLRERWPSWDQPPRPPAAS